MLKSGDLTNPGDWRPIKQTCIPAIILEKIVHKRFMRILDNNNFLNGNQYGLIKGRSTQQATFNLAPDLYRNLNSNLISGLLFLDVRKAFDSLNHQVLLSKLRSLGIGHVISWLCYDDLLVI